MDRRIYLCAFDHIMILEILFFFATGCLLIQTTYWGLNWIRIINHHPSKSESELPVSIIICAHNELENLKTLLPKLKSQRYPNFEIIVVNDRSDDDTYDFLLEYNDPLVKPTHVNQVHDHITAKKYAITLGVKAAKNDVLLFIDADCEPVSDNWISAMTGNMTDKTEFGLGVSQYHNGKGLLNYIIRLETLFTAINYIGFALMGNPYMGVGRNLVYRKSIFLNNKGFNRYQGVTGGDDDLLVNQLAKGSKTIVNLGYESLTVSIPKSTWADWLLQKTRHISVSKHYSFKDKVLLGLQNLSHCLFWISLVCLIIFTTQYVLAAGLFVFRVLFMSFLCHSTSKRFGDRMNVGLVSVLDILYVFYVGIIGLTAVFTKNVKWK